MLEEFFSPLLISLMGSLPFGNVNLTATQLAVQENYKSAWLYSIGIAIVEIIYLRITLTAMNWVIQHQTIFTVMGWLTVALFLFLGIMGFVAAKKQAPDKKGFLLNNNMNRFLLGVSISAVNPAQFPFWFMWSTTFIKQGVLHTSNWHYNNFTLGAGIGTIIAMAIYIYAGKWVIQKLKASNKQLNIVMGAVFIICALYQVYTMLTSPNFVKH